MPGPAMVNHGAVLGEDGFRFVHTDPDWMEAPFPGQPERAELTLEAWVRDWQTPDDAVGYIASYYHGDDGYLIILAERIFAAPNTSRISVQMRSPGGWTGPAWIAEEVTDLLDDPDPWHVAAVMDNPGKLTLFVNGIQRAAANATGAVAAGDYTLKVGCKWNTTLHVSAVIDEVRLSKAVRYTGGVNGIQYFTPQRLYIP